MFLPFPFLSPGDDILHAIIWLLVFVARTNSFNCLQTAVAMKAALGSDVATGKAAKRVTAVLGRRQLKKDDQPGDKLRDVQEEARPAKRHSGHAVDRPVGACPGGSTGGTRRRGYSACRPRSVQGRCGDGSYRSRCCACVSGTPHLRARSPGPTPCRADPRQQRSATRTPP